MGVDYAENDDAVGNHLKIDAVRKSMEQCASHLAVNARKY